MLNFATVIIAFPAGIFADRVGKLPVLLLSFLVFMGTSLAGVVLVGYWAYGLLIAIFYGGYLSISDTVQRAMVPDFTRPELKGTAYAFYYTIIAIGSLVANSVFGALWTSLGVGGGVPVQHRNLRGRSSSLNPLCRSPPAFGMSNMLSPENYTTY